jgi:hypothetical protein
MKQIFPRNGALLEFKDVIPTSVIRSIIGFKFKSSPWQIVGDIYYMELLQHYMLSN